MSPRLRRPLRRWLVCPAAAPSVVGTPAACSATGPLSPIPAIGAMAAIGDAVANRCARSRAGGFAYGASACASSIADG